MKLTLPLSYSVAFCLLLACTPTPTRPISATPAPTTPPTAMSSPSSTPSIQPTSSPSQPPTASLPPIPSPVPTIAPSSLPVELFRGYMNEDTQNRYLHVLYAQQDGQGIAIWNNGMQSAGQVSGQGGVRLRDFKSTTALGGLPELGPAVTQLDSAGNGMIAWYSALPANLFQEVPPRYLYTQQLANFQPTGAPQREGVFHPLAVNVDANGNGWLLLNDERPPVYGDKHTTATQYPDVLHVQARQVSGYKLQAKTENIIEISYVKTMDTGYLDAQGNGFVVWSVPNTGIGYRLLTQAFQNFKPTGSALGLANQAQDRRWLEQRAGEGALTWVEYEASDIPQTLHIRPLQQGKLATTSRRLQVSTEIGQALVVSQIAVSLNAKGDGLLIWQQGVNQLFSQRIQNFVLTQKPVALVDSAQALQMKLSLDMQGNGLAAWIEKTGCEQGTACTNNWTLRSRAVLKYQVQ